MQEIKSIPDGWKVEEEEVDDIINYKYTEIVTGEYIEGSALVSHYDSTMDVILEYIKERENQVELRVAEVTGSQISRKIIEMVGLLHSQGYESLYIDSYMAPSGCYWRYHIGVALYGKWPQANFGVGMKGEVGPAGSIGGGFDQNIPWCLPGDSLDSYTQKFIEKYPEILRGAKSPNPQYVKWYKDMLIQTAPEGVLIFGCDMGAWYEHAFTWGEPEDFKMPMPPGYIKK